MAEVVAHPTPNPEAYKFTIEGHTFAGPATFSDAAAATGTPFAPLFALPGVVGVFATANFVTVTKDPSAAWSALVPPVREALSASF